jgi:1-deoxyxylulose-5-phosphate synthase
VRTARLGDSDLLVSRVGLGCNNFGGRLDLERTREVVDAALDAGITFFDTADVYGNRGGSERLLGELLQGRRDRVVLATKFGMDMGEGPNGSADYVRRAMRASLERLQTDRVDLYYAHDPDPDTPLEQTLAVYDDLIRQGKIRYVGLSNHPAWQVTRALWIADDRRLQAPVAAEVKYNLIDRAAERELAPACQQLGLSLVAYAPLHGGLLADPAVLQRDVAGDGRFGAAGFTDAEVAVAREVDRLSRAWGLAPYQVSLAWLLSRPAVASAIVGPETPEELHANATAVDVRLEPAQLAALTSLAAEPPAFHHRAGDGPRRPSATDSLNGEPSPEPHENGNPPCPTPTRPPSIC